MQLPHRLRQVVNSLSKQLLAVAIPDSVLVQRVVGIRHVPQEESSGGIKLQGADRICVVLVDDFNFEVSGGSPGLVFHGFHVEEFDSRVGVEDEEFAVLGPFDLVNNSSLIRLAQLLQIKELPLLHNMHELELPLIERLGFLIPASPGDDLLQVNQHHLPAVSLCVDGDICEVVLEFDVQDVQVFPLDVLGELDLVGEVVAFAFFPTDKHDNKFSIS